MNYDKGLVVIIIANYNGQQVLGECIESIYKSTYVNYKILVVDDCSTDSSVAGLRKNFPDVEVMENSRNSGFAATNNQGIRAAVKKYHAEYCLLLNNDTVIDSKMLEILVEASQGTRVAAPKMYFAYPSNRLWYDGGELDLESGCGFHHRFGMIDSKSSKPVSRMVSAAPFCCVLLPTEIIRKVGLLRTQYFMYLEDSDYCARLKEQNLKIVYCPQAVLWHKVSYSMGSARNPVIIYYFTRNRLFFTRYHVKGNRWKVYLRVIRDMWKESMEQPDWKRKWYVIAGICDFLLNRTGKYSY